jgi:glycine betaine/proline transport system ATP-binding protein
MSSNQQTEMPAVRAEHLYKIFSPDERRIGAQLAGGESLDLERVDGTAAVVDANFTVRQGESFVVMGLSGSGKSTLIRMLNGLTPPTAGRVEINGIDITAASREELRQVRRESISMVFQHFALLPHRTVAANVAYGLEIKQAPKDTQRDQAQHWMERVGLGDAGEKFPDQLSGGMQQRVGLARALASGTDILLMDEAFSALDPLIRADLQEQLLDLQAELGKTIVFITHDLNEAMRLGDRVAVMQKGRIVQIGTAPELLTNPADDYVARFVDRVDRSQVLTAGMVADTSMPVVAGDTPVAELMRTLESEGHTAAVVVEGTRPLGAVLLTDARDTVAATAAGLVHRSRPVPRITPIAELFARCAHEPAPLVVVDRAGRLVGLLSQDRLLNAMSSSFQASADSMAATGPGAR